jgi:ParB family chromosome partitioning protein
MAKSALGKGLGALIGTRPAPALDVQMVQSDPGEKVHQVSLNDIVASPLQPRSEFAAEALQELVESIRQHGIIQPLIVRMVNGKHELIAGERRWRAAREVGLTEVPVIVREATDLDVLELSLIENLQRADLNPIEEALAYARLAGEFGMRQEDIALKVGRSRAAVANSMRLLDLHQQVQSWVTQGLLSVGHAKVLLGLKAHDEQLAVAETILRRSATVRDAERSWRGSSAPCGVDGARPAAQRSPPRRSTICKAVCSSISAHVSSFITARSAARSRSNTTATMISSACSA